MIPTLALIEGSDLSFYEKRKLQSTLITSNTTWNGATWNHTSQVLALAGKGTSDIVILVSVESGEIIESISSRELKESDVRSIRFGGNSRYLCLATPSHILLWDLKRKTVARKFACQDSLFASLDSTDKFMYIVGENAVSVYNIKQATLVQSDSLDSKIVAATLSNEETLAIACNDGKIHCYSPDLERQRSVQYSESILDLQWIDPATLAVLGKRKVSVHEYPSLTVIWERPLDHPSCFSVYKNYIAAGSQTGNVSVIAWQRNAVVETFSTSNQIDRLSFRTSERRVDPGSSHKSVATEASTIGPLTAASGALLRGPQMIDDLRDEMQESLRNLHIDMIRQFQLQSEDFERALARQAQALEQLASDNRSLRLENAALRDENERLKRNVK